ncbi:YaeQ family protein [Leucobacter denitrificans]|uniref:YaeQ family protein n=1 Tax=Leucobacter denitrificans TaxID=683042 RepID=A0A7G9S6B6_9MICO|nr:YaeQ family protein [Leucobacter denitrificans]QNN63391.1 YaeQ family protein [Leucobacter denitrificans]
MTIGATIHTFEVELSDVDREVYEQLSLRVARHPSETDAYMVTRVLAYLLEYEEGIAFGAGGVSSTDEPALLVRDLTGQITKWIEVGAPDAARLHHGSKLAGSAAVYTHRDVDQLLGSWAGKTIHRAEGIAVRAFDRRFIDAAADSLERRNTLTCSATEGQLYLVLNGATLETTIDERRLG